MSDTNAAEAGSEFSGPVEDEKAAEPVSNATESAADDSKAPVGPETFAAFPIGDEIKNAIAAMGFEKPMEVQSAVIEAAIKGSDLVVQAQTGSGKTSAFGIPIVERLDPGASAPGEPKALIIAPTRELAHQVSIELTSLGEPKGVTVAAVYGGVSIGRQAARLRAGVDIVVGTPGRLLDHSRRGNLSLSAVRTFVLDEADEMLSMGFWDEVTDLLKLAPKERQTLLFSATLPYQVAKAAAQFLREPVRIDVSGDKLTVEGIENHIYHVVPDLPKPRQLMYLLEAERPESTIVFCNTRNETEMIATYLTQSGFVAAPLSSNLRQRDRDRVMARIKNGDLRYMVATDIAARGIDISDLSHVFNYSLPEFTEVYLHRTGRTGRVGKLGTAVSLVDGRGLTTLTQLEKEFGIEFKEVTLPEEDEADKIRSERIMKELAEKASVAEVGQHLPVAQEIIASDDSGQIVAFLLKAYFNTQAAQHVAPDPAERPRRPERHGGRDDAAQEGGPQGPRRRRRRRRRRGGEHSSEGPMATLDAAAALAGEASADSPAPVEPSNNGGDTATEKEEGYARLRVNIGFEDGFKGRGAVAKKISALAGLNDGIVKEVESRRDHAVLRVTSEIAELLVDRVDGAQIGKKIVSIAPVR